MRIWMAALDRILVSVGVKRRIHCTTLLCVLIVGVACEHKPVAAQAPGGDPARSAWVYPAAPRSSVVEEHQGVQVADPFRSLEDLNSSETMRWVAGENRITDSYFATLSSVPAFRARLAQLSNSESYGLPRRRGDRYFWMHNNGKQDQAVLFTALRLDDDPTLLVDPNALSPDGSLAFIGYSISNDGHHIAYELSIGGGDWIKFRIRSVDTSGAETPEELEHIKYYPPSFSPDGRGIYYSRFQHLLLAKRFPRPITTAGSTSILSPVRPPLEALSSTPGRII